MFIVMPALAGGRKAPGPAGSRNGPPWARSLSPSSTMRTIVSGPSETYIPA